MAKRGVNEKKEKQEIKKTEEAFGKIRIHHNKNVLFVIAILFVILILLVIFLRQSKEIPPAAECSSDSDCIKQQTTCCPCQSGGQEACMTRQNSSYWQARLQSCGNLFCIEMYNCQIKNCVCKEGRCQAIK